MADIETGDNGYPVIMKKQKYLDHIWKSSAATQFQDRPRVNNFSTTSKWSYRISNTICKTNKVVLQQTKIKSQTGSQSLVRKTMSQGSTRKTYLVDKFNQWRSKRAC